MGKQRQSEFPVCRLGAFAKARQGYTFSPQYQGITAAQWPYAKVSDMTLPGNEKYLKKTTNYVTDEILDQMRALPFAAGTILFPRVGAALRTNKKRILFQDCLVDDNIMTISVTNQDVCDSEFLYYWLESIDLNDLANDGALPSINSKNLLSCFVPLPPLAEQRKIAAILGTWDEAIAAVQALIKALQERKRGLMQRLLTGQVRFPGFVGEWEEVKIDDVALINPRKPEGLTEHTEISFVGMSDLSEDGKLIGCITKHYGEVSSGYTPFVDNDILVAKITPCLENGKGALVHGLQNGIGFGSTEFHVIRANTAKVLPKFLFYHTISHKFRKQAERNMVGSAGQKRVQPGFVAAYSLMLPPLSEQDKIAEVLTVTDSNIELLMNYSRQLQAQKKALMQRLLTGQVAVSGF